MMDNGPDVLANCVCVIMWCVCADVLYVWCIHSIMCVCVCCSNMDTILYHFRPITSCKSFDFYIT